VGLHLERIGIAEGRGVLSRLQIVTGQRGRDGRRQVGARRWRSVLSKGEAVLTTNETLLAGNDKHRATASRHPATSEQRLQPTEHCKPVQDVIPLRRSVGALPKTFSRCNETLFPRTKTDPSATRRYFPARLDLEDRFPTPASSSVQIPNFYRARRVDGSLSRPRANYATKFP
jgi:hypothetical protein